MKKIFPGTIIALIIASFTFAQNVTLKPSIGLFEPPSAGDGICTIVPVNQEQHDIFAPGDTVADFTLYTTAGDPLTLSELINSTGKNILLYTCSYT